MTHVLKTNPINLTPERFAVLRDRLLHPHLAYRSPEGITIEHHGRDFTADIPDLDLSFIDAQKGGATNA